VYVNTPIITGSDAEGAGEMFKVTALPFDGTPRTEDGKVNYKISSERQSHGFRTTGGETLRWLWVRFILLDQPLEADSNTSRHLADFG
jgi:asparaginyl-tRNA synthetase